MRHTTRSHCREKGAHPTPFSASYLLQPLINAIKIAKMPPISPMVRASPRLSVKCCTAIYMHVFPESIHGYHQFQGHFQGNTSNMDQCVSRCLSFSGCHGIDWNINYNSCWFHNLERECKELAKAQGVIHHRLTDQCGELYLKSLFECTNQGF